MEQNNSSKLTIKNLKEVIDTAIKPIENRLDNIENKRLQNNSNSSKLTMKNIKEVVDTSIQNAIKPIENRLDNIENRLDNIENKRLQNNSNSSKITMKNIKEVIDTALKPIENRLTNVENKLNNFVTEVNGYIKRESDIFELISCDCYEKYLSDDHIKYKKLNIRNIYNMKDKDPVTDFDGVFLINYLPPEVTKNTNSIKQFRNTQLVIIEAKHGIDKNKIDNKLKQLDKIYEVFENHNKVLINPKLLNNANSNFKKLIENEDFLLASRYINPFTVIWYIATDDWTSSLEGYIQAITNGTLVPKKNSSEEQAQIERNEGEKLYYKLCYEILLIHEGGLCLSISDKQRTIINHYNNIIKDKVVEQEEFIEKIKQFDINELYNAKIIAKYFIKLDINTIKFNTNSNIRYRSLFEYIKDFKLLMDTLNNYITDYNELYDSFVKLTNHLGIIKNNKVYSSDNIKHITNTNSHINWANAT
jgi:hypothetical protein